LSKDYVFLLLINHHVSLYYNFHVTSSIARPLCDSAASYYVVLNQHERDLLETMQLWRQAAVHTEYRPFNQRRCKHSTN